MGRFLRCAALVVVASLALAPAADAAMPGRVVVTDRIRAHSGETVELFRNADVRITGRCVDAGGGDFRANTFLAARRDNLLYFANDVGFDLDFDRGDLKVDFVSAGKEANGTSPAYAAEDSAQDVYVEGKRGRISQGRVATGVHLRGADCVFSGIFTTFARSGPVRLARRIKTHAGEQVTLFANQDFKVTGRCEDAGGGDLVANTFLAARRDNLAYFASSSGIFDADFDRADGSVDFVNVGWDASGTMPSFRGYDYYQYFYAEGTGGKLTQGRVATGVHVRGADCTFSGIFLDRPDSGGAHLVRRVKADAGEQVTLFTNEDFKVTGRCLSNLGTHANTYLRARRDNLLYYASEGPLSDLRFDRADGPVDFTTYDAVGFAPDFAAWNYYDDFYAEGRGGRVLQGWVATGVNVRGADCTFSGIFVG